MKSKSFSEELLQTQMDWILYSQCEFSQRKKIGAYPRNVALKK